MRISRRTMLGGSVLLAGGMFPWQQVAGQESEPPTPAEALARLTEGNRKFAAHEPPSAAAAREAAPGQQPWVTMVCCSDSRVPPELIYGQGPGKMFIVRNAGNTIASAQSMGSIEYSVLVLKVPLIVVLGHYRCGAVEAATDIVQKNTIFPGSINALVEPIVPAALAMRHKPKPIERAIEENVIRVRDRLRSPEQPILYPPYRDKKLIIVGAVFDIDTGKVHLLPG